MRAPRVGSMDRCAAGREKGAGDRQRSKIAMISIMAAAPQDVVASSGAPLSTAGPSAPARVATKRAIRAGDDAMTDASTPLDAQKQRARAWFETLRDDLCAAFERLEADLPAGAPPRRSAAGPLRAHAVDPDRSQRRGRRRRGDEPDQGPRVREGRHPRLHRARRVRAGVPQANPRRRGRPALLGLGRVADRPSGQPATCRPRT